METEVAAAAASFSSVEAAITSTNPTSTLVFDSIEALQTRLVLLPRVEEEGLGAVVQSFLESDNENNDIMASEQQVGEENNSLKGSMLVAVTDRVQQTITVKDMEFSEILAVLRDANPPVHLELTRESLEESDCSQIASLETANLEVAPLDENRHGRPTTIHDDEDRSEIFQEEKKTEPIDIMTLPTVAPAETDAAVSTNTTGEEQGPTMQQSLLSWASRLSATSAHMAQQAMEAAAERRKAATIAAASTAKFSSAHKPSNADKHTRQNSVGVNLYIQTSSGAFLTVPNEKQRPGSELRVTNASLLMIRKSSTEPCPTESYKFQWYRSVEHGLTCETSSDTPCEWTELPGATSPAFQPTSAEVGHRIKCVVTQSLDMDESSSDDTDSEDDDISHASATESRVCSVETFDCVAASLALFNGARQALLKGAHFGGIIKQGNSIEQKFRIKVEMLITKDPESKKTTSISSIWFYQVSGPELTPLHDEEEPILGCTALPDYENSKNFEIVLPDKIPATASRINGLAKDGSLRLSASNRLGRESLLLSIGIANYTGESSTLTPTSVLFCDPGVAECEDKILKDHATRQSNPVDSDIDSSQSSGGDRPPLVPKQDESTHNLAPETIADEDSIARIKELERELNSLRSRVSKKDRMLGEMEKKLQLSDSNLSKLKHEATKKDIDLNEAKRKLLVAERRMQSQEDDMKRMRSDNTRAVESLNRELNRRATTIADLEKSLRVVQNEKAVLSATVEARESKLAKMAELQSALEEMKDEVDKTNEIRESMQKVSGENESLIKQLENVAEQEEALRSELSQSQEMIATLTQKFEIESKKLDSCRGELDTQQIRIQKLKAERNSYKQKSDSLSKEIAKVCRHGRTIKEVEKIITDDSARRQEVKLLRDQKRKALEDLEHYRTLYEQCREAQRIAGVDHESTKVYERNAELERLLSELTEYVSAKEMQLETLKAVNDALQAEIRELHRSQMSKNLGKNDV
jgi:hypothetical protein